MVPHFRKERRKKAARTAGAVGLGAAAGLGGAALGLTPVGALGLGAAAALGGSKILGKSNRSAVASGLFGRRKQRMNKG